MGAARRPLPPGVVADVRVQQDDAADGTDRHRARRCCLGDRTTDHGALGGQPADERASARDCADRGRQ
jgi:hypothetical protein